MTAKSDSIHSSTSEVEPQTGFSTSKNDTKPDHFRQPADDSLVSSNYLSPGSLLSEARKKKNLTIDDVAKELKLSPDYIASIEKDDYSLISSAVYARGYLQMYGRLLGVDRDKLIAAFNAKDFIKTSSRRDPLGSYKKYTLNKGAHRPWMVYGGLGFIAIVSLLGVVHLYKTFSQSSTNLQPPLIKLSVVNAAEDKASQLSAPPKKTAPKKAVQPPSPSSLKQSANHDEQQDQAYSSYANPSDMNEDNDYGD